MIKHDKGRECGKCGTVLKDTRQYIWDCIGQSLQVVCFRCYFDYNSPWWKKTSRQYRKEKGWKCEECGLSLSDDTKYLSVHHSKGTQYNQPEDLKALCIGCHSEQQGDNHQKLKKTPKYRDFMAKYGKRWKSLKQNLRPIQNA